MSYEFLYNFGLVLNKNDEVETPLLSFEIFDIYGEVLDLYEIQRRRPVDKFNIKRT